MTFEFYRPPLEHQHDAFERFKNERIHALFWEPRVRKTSVELNIFRYRCEVTRDVDALIAIAFPNGVHRVWIDELPKEYPPEFMEKLAYMPWESGKMTTGERREKVLGLRDHDGPVILTMNCEALITPAGWRYLQWFLAKRRTMLVADECFVAGTNVNTPKGPCPIEYLSVGDLVVTPSGSRRIQKVFKGGSDKLVSLLAAQEAMLTVTPNHPLFTDLGWTCAAAAAGRILPDEREIMRLLWEEFLPPKAGGPLLFQDLRRSPYAEATSSGEGGTWDNCGLQVLWQTVQEVAEERQAILQSILLDEMAFSTTEISRQSHNTSVYCSNSVQAGVYAMEQGQALARSIQEEHERRAQREGFNLQATWWERSYAAGAAAPFAECLGSAMDCGIPHLVGAKATWLSNLLQGRFSLSRTTSRNRSGWSEPSSTQASGFKERQQTSGIRVDRVENIQLAHPVPVFDLQLEGDPRYFANGVLVHNSSWAANWSARTRKLLSLGGHKNVLVKSILDGTPVDEGPEDIFFPTQFLRKGLLGFNSKLAFRSRYLAYQQDEHGNRVKGFNRKTGSEYDIIVGTQNLEELHSKLMTFGSRVLRKDVSDAPEKTYQPRYFDMTDKQRKVYEKARDEYVAELEGGSFPLMDVLLRVTRLQMIARNYYPPEKQGAACPVCNTAGFVEDEECRRWEGLGYVVEWTKLQRIDKTNAAAEALVQEAQATRGPLVVWCCFKQDVRDAMEALRSIGREPLQYDGSLPAAEREANYQAFRSGKGTDIVGTILSGLSRGKDLTRAEALVYYSNVYSLRARRQSEDRAESLLRKVSTDVVDLIASDTRDLHNIQALREKRSRSEIIMGDAPVRWL